MGLAEAVAALPAATAADGDRADSASNASIHLISL
jgi:hypothetical protein